MNGIIIINKEKGWTSNDIVQKLKNIVHEKVGHTGTLDPFATGVLPILVGKGTQLSKYLINHDKEYIATIKLGQKTDTADSEGKIREEKEIKENNLKEEFVKKALQSFKGKINQIPPMYSAIKVNGKKLYEYARKGQNIDIPTREIEIYKIELVFIDIKQKEIQYKVKCSKGTYIRTLSEKIAEKLGTVGFTKELNRTEAGFFNIKQAVKISDIIKNENIIKRYFISLEDFLKNKENIVLDNDKLKSFLNGAKIQIQKQDEIYRIYDKSGIFIGVGELKNNRLKRDIII